VWLESAAAGRGEREVYLSAGVHGDEAGASSGLLGWAQRNAERVSREPVVLFPCLNPHGLMANTRMDERGLDLNRRFHLADDPVCGAWQRVMAGRRMRLAICLHEDYDAQGFYVYELSLHAEGWSREILRHVERGGMPVDARKRIDGRPAKGGVIQRKKSPRGLPGMPEAVMLYELGCGVSLTFETPSEFDLSERVKAHGRFIDAALKVTPKREGV
jgi:protein MpaA